MPYIDGFVLAVPTAKKKEFVRHAELGAQVIRECGALSIVENWGVDVPDGKTTSFPLAVKCRPDETVVFSWITWSSKAARDEGMQKAMQDPRMQPDHNPMPYDGMRMIFGGFETVVEA